MRIWPSDVDGDVLREMEASGFDFSKPVPIDFNVDFATWPPPKQALDILAAEFPDLEIHEPEGEFDGSVQFQVHSLVSYELVMRIQRDVTELMAPFGGRCDSWGVMSGPPTH